LAYGVTSFRGSFPKFHISDHEQDAKVTNKAAHARLNYGLCDRSRTGLNASCPDGPVMSTSAHLSVGNNPDSELFFAFNSRAPEKRGTGKMTIQDNPNNDTAAGKRATREE
jgi:hypothetical protein